MKITFLLSLFIFIINVFPMDIIEKRKSILSNGYSPEVHGAPLAFATLFTPSHFSPKEDWIKYFELYFTELNLQKNMIKRYKNYCCKNKKIKLPQISNPTNSWPKENQQKKILSVAKAQYDKYRLLQAELEYIRNILINSLEN